MLWDDTYFYVAAQLEEPHVWGTLTKHDSVIFQDNDFEIFIDPDGDNHEYYEIEINALNTEWDLFLKKPYRDGGPADQRVGDPRPEDGRPRRGHAQRSDATRTSSGRSSSRSPGRSWPSTPTGPAPPRDGDQWRVNFSRVEWQHDVVDGKYRKVPGHAGGQLGLVAPGRHRHAPPRALGLRPVLDRTARYDVVQTQPRRSDAAGFAGFQKAIGSFFASYRTFQAFTERRSTTHVVVTSAMNEAERADPTKEVHSTPEQGANHGRGRETR